MPRADLHNALVLDRDIFEASKVDATLLDPIVRVDGGLPGNARPIAVVRDYQGPQGAYLEYFVLADSKGRPIMQSQSRRIELRGEMFEDRFVDVLEHVRIERGDEHQATFFVNDDEVATIPVFVESGMGGDPALAAKETFNKAVSKGNVLWLTVPQPQPRKAPRRGVTLPATATQAVWYVWTDGKIYVFNGPTEQQVPGLPEATTVQMTARSKDLRSRVADIPAAVTTVPNDSERFEVIAKMGLGRRLNLPDGDGAFDRWRAKCTLFELTPDFGEERAAAPAKPGAPGAGADDGGAAPADNGAAAGEKPAEEDIHVEVQVDQAVYDQLIAEGKSERIARAKAKAAYVRAEKARIRAERADA